MGLVVPEFLQVEHLVARAEVRGEVRTDEPTDWASLSRRGSPTSRGDAEGWRVPTGGCTSGRW